MNKKKRNFFISTILILLAVVFTILVKVVDVKQVGGNGTSIGFATVNQFVFKSIGVNMIWYYITDWLGLVPIFMAMVYSLLGLVQLIKRKSLLKVDSDIIILGIHYVIVISGYLIFEMIPINYRPILINGFMEASYPSSTTLLVLGVMPTVIFQINRRVKNIKIKNIISAITIIFSVFMVVGRLISGVHWVTDIVGSVLLSMGLFYIYKGTVFLALKGDSYGI